MDISKKMTHYTYHLIIKNIHIDFETETETETIPYQNLKQNVCFLVTLLLELMENK